MYKVQKGGGGAIGRGMTEFLLSETHYLAASYRHNLIQGDLGRKGLEKHKVWRSHDQVEGADYPDTVCGATCLFILLSLMLPRWTQDSSSSRRHLRLCHAHVSMLLLFAHRAGYLQMPHTHVCYKGISSLEEPCYKLHLLKYNLPIPFCQVAEYH